MMYEPHLTILNMLCEKTKKYLVMSKKCCTFAKNFNNQPKPTNTHA